MANLIKLPFFELLNATAPRALLTNRAANKLLDKEAAAKEWKAPSYRKIFNVSWRSKNRHSVTTLILCKALRLQAQEAAKHRVLVFGEVALTEAELRVEQRRQAFALSGRRLKEVLPCTATRYQYARCAYAGFRKGYTP